MAEVLLEARHLQKAFEGNQVLRDVSVQVRRGEVVVVVGPSGCGKSTLLRCLNGLETVDGGEILLSGQPVGAKKKDLCRMRQRVGMVFQSYDLFPHLDVMGNLAAGADQGAGDVRRRRSRPKRLRRFRGWVCLKRRTRCPGSSRAARSSGWRWCARC